MLAWKVIRGPTETPEGGYSVFVLVSNANKQNTWVEELLFKHFNDAYQMNREIDETMEPIKVKDWREQLI